MINILITQEIVDAESAKAPEPVAYMNTWNDGKRVVLSIGKAVPFDSAIFASGDFVQMPLYTSPPEVAELQKQVQALQAQLKKEFANGILTAAAIFQSINDQPSMAASILRGTCLNFYDCSELDDFDKEHLRKINKETDMHLTGLNKS